MAAELGKIGSSGCTVTSCQSAGRKDGATLLNFVWPLSPKLRRRVPNGVMEFSYRSTPSTPPCPHVWSSLRTQTLYPTVSGVMNYREVKLQSKNSKNCWEQDSKKKVVTFHRQSGGQSSWVMNVILEGLVRALGGNASTQTRRKEIRKDKISGLNE
ncbi:hypothetical protein BDN67DRAFT_688940 [Paxillus ammoniavirescens]|nr:hypothetical protein BDN67DRAFT_688940 [Paxillus ammoniavirescens]